MCQRAVVKNEGGNAVLEFAVAFPGLIAVCFLVLNMAMLCTTKLLTVYATFMAARAAGVAVEDTRADVAAAQGATILGRSARLLPPVVEKEAIGLATLHAPIVGGDGTFRSWRGSLTTMPLIAFPRGDPTASTKEDNPLP